MVILKQLLYKLSGKKFVMRVVLIGSHLEKGLGDLVESGRLLLELEQAILFGNLHVE
jgi:hypothetical protein